MRTVINLIIGFVFILVLNSCSWFQNSEDTTDSTKMTKWEIWSNGTQLRGANIYQRRIYPELDGYEFMGAGLVGPPYTQSDFFNLAELGANYVNISHPGIFLEKPPYQLDSAILDHLKNLIKMISNADMFVVISFRTGPGRSEFTFFWDEDEDWFDSSYYNDRVWINQSAQSAWSQMWKETALFFHDYEAVIGYDLMVEPNSNEVWLDLWDQEEFYHKYSLTLYDWNPFFADIVNSIREVDSETPILVGGMGYSAIDWLPYIIPASDPRMIYTVHQYNPEIYIYQDPGGQYSYPGNFDADWDGKTEMVNKNWLDLLLGTIDSYKSRHNVPVACNEYGIIRWISGAAQFMDDQMDLFEQKRLNYALWVWEPSWKAWTDEVTAFNFRFGPDPNNSKDVPNPLLDVIKKYWQKNALRPSNVFFKGDK